MRVSVLSFLLLYSLFSCQRSGGSNIEVSKFKEFVGKRNFDITNDFLAKMEHDLKRTYPDLPLKESIYAYLDAQATGVNPIYFTKDDCDSFREYYYSGMESKSRKMYYDTSFYYDGLEYWQMKGDTIALRRLGKDEIHHEEIVDYPTHIYQCYVYGLVLEGLEYAAPGDSVVYRYIDQYRQVGKIDNRVLAAGILYGNIDMSSSFIRKLLVLTEFYYEDLEKLNCVLTERRIEYGK